MPTNLGACQAASLLTPTDPVAGAGSAFPIPRGSVADKNRLADKILREIVENRVSAKPDRQGIIEVWGRDGRGVAFNPDGSFRSWLEPRTSVHGPRLPSR